MDSNSIKRKICERVIGRRPKKDSPYLGEGYYAVTGGYAGVMDVQAIKRFDLVGKLADSACLVFLWTTNKFLRPSYNITERWGFENLPLTLVWNKGQGPQFPNSPSYHAEKKSGTPYKAVVSVLMLREGWDVPEVGVVLLLRKFSSKVYGQQVIGRGLRRVRAKGVQADERQICAAVDHPKLEHQWLWDIFDAKKREGVLIDQEFDETEDLSDPPPKQELTQPHLVIDVPDPDPSVMEVGEFDIGDIQDPPKPLENWKEALDGMEYDPTAIEITEVDIAGVVGQELGGEGWKTVHSAPEKEDSKSAVVKISDPDLREATKDALLQMAEELTIEAGYAALDNKAKVYSALRRHVCNKFLKGSSIGMAERSEVEFAGKMLAQVRKKVSSAPGLIGGIIEYGD